MTYAEASTSTCTQPHSFVPLAHRELLTLPQFVAHSPSSSLVPFVAVMLLFTLFSLLIPLATAQYELQSSFYGLTFFDNFEFYTSWDPTYGYVHYVDQAIAQQFGMINITNSSVSWGVDTTQLLNPSANLGRPSIRLVSLQSWTHGLFILDLAHMPSNTCGVWPALWMLGSGLWPTTGTCLKTTL